MKINVLTLLVVIASFGRAWSQATFMKPDSIKESFLTHKKNNWLVGAGVTYLGFAAKGGRFIANNWWVGAEVERHDFLSTRQEAGLFARYYTGERMINGFIGGGVSYGQFKTWDWDFDGVRPDPPLYRSVKLNALIGVEMRLTKRFSIEGVAKAGRLTAIDWIQPSFQGSINYYLGN